MPLTIVTGFDGSDTSYRALAMAIGVASREQGCVRACTVCPMPVFTPPSGLSIAPTAHLYESKGDLVRSASKEMADAGVTGDCTCVYGDAAIELEKLAESCAADLIVVGCSRRPRLHRRAVPRRLLAMRRTPVLVVP